MDAEHILQVYEGISDITRRMLDAARGHDWERLAALEKECGVRLQSLLGVEDSLPRDAEYQRRKAALIRRVLDDDAQIRDIVEPWMAKLGELIGSSARQRRLVETYHERA